MLASLSLGMSDFACSYTGKVQKVHTSSHINWKVKKEAKIVQSWKKTWKLRKFFKNPSKNKNTTTTKTSQPCEEKSTSKREKIKKTTWKG